MFLITVENNRVRPSTIPQCPNQHSRDCVGLGRGRNKSDGAKYTFKFEYFSSHVSKASWKAFERKERGGGG